MRITLPFFFSLENVFFFQMMVVNKKYDYYFDHSSLHLEKKNNTKVFTGLWNIIDGAIDDNRQNDACGPVN